MGSKKVCKIGLIVSPNRVQGESLVRLPLRMSFYLIPLIILRIKKGSCESIRSIKSQFYEDSVATKQIVIEISGLRNKCER